MLTLDSEALQDQVSVLDKGVDTAINMWLEFDEDIVVHNKGPADVLLLFRKTFRRLLHLWLSTPQLQSIQAMVPSQILLLHPQCYLFLLWQEHLAS